MAIPTSSVATTSSVARSSLIDRCDLSGDVDPGIALLYCLSQQFDELENDIGYDMKQKQNWLLVFAGALVFFMQAGFAMLVGGCVRKKNLQNTMLKNVLDVCGAAIAFWALGFGLAYGGDSNTDRGITFVGHTHFFGVGNDIDLAFWFFQFTFSATAVTIVAGTLAERCQMAAYLWYSLFMTGFLYPVVVHTVWSAHGKFSAFVPAEDRMLGVGAIDFAGSGVVHLTGGTVALVATYVLGPRVGRFHDGAGKKLDKPADMPGHSIALQVLGTLILWFGWYGFNPGSALLLSDAPSRGYVAARAAVNSSLSAAFGAVSAMAINMLIEKRKDGTISFNLTMTMNGLLSGLVAITAGAATVELFSAVIIGTVGGAIYVASTKLLVKIEIDDAVDAIPVHMFNGAWGVLATGLLSSPNGMMSAFGHDDHVGWFYSVSDGALLANQIILICFVVGWATFVMFPFFSWLNYMGWFRSNGLEEVVGLDIRYHGGDNQEADDEVKKDLEKYAEIMHAKRKQKEKTEEDERSSIRKSLSQFNGVAADMARASTMSRDSMEDSYGSDA